MDLHARRHVFPSPDGRMQVHIRDHPQRALKPLHGFFE